MPRQSVRLPRDGADARRPAARKKRRRRRRGAGGARRPRPRPPSAATRVTLFDAAAEIGGQFNLARRIPGKEEFAETLRYFRTRLAQARRRVALGAARATPTTSRASTTSIARDRHRAARAGDPGHRSSEGRELRRRSSRARKAAGAHGRDRRRGRHRLRRRRVPDRRRRAGRACERRRRRDPAIAAFRDEWGIDADLRARAAASMARARARAAAPGLAAAAQGDEGRRGTREDDRLDPPHAAEAAAA